MAGVIRWCIKRTAEGVQTPAAILTIEWRPRKQARIAGRPRSDIRG